MLPDADVIGLKLGLAYEDVLGHRGLTHSLVFALVLGFLTARFLFPRESSAIAWWRTGVFLSAITATHGLADAMTDGGLGIAFFSPFHAERYFLLWRPIIVSPISLRAFLSQWGIDVARTEILTLWCPLVALAGIRLLLSRSSQVRDDSGDVDRPTT